MTKIAPYLKALVGFITPGVVGLVAAVQDISPGGSAITGPEWVGIGAACILTGSAVFGVPNLDPTAKHQDESVQPPSTPIADAPAPVADAPAPAPLVAPAPVKKAAAKKTPAKKATAKKTPAKRPTRPTQG